MNTRTLWLALAALGVLPSASVFAGDGVIEINQARAEAGDVTPGDLPDFPISILQPGSYRLTSDLRVSGAVTAIGVDSLFVTIDLNGFTIFGPCTFGAPGCVPGGSGAGIAAPLGYVTVRNGFIWGMNEVGLVAGPGSRVEGVSALSCYGNGIHVVSGGWVRSSQALYNTGVGLQLGPGTSFADNESLGNGAGSRVGGIATGGNLCDDGRCTRDGRRRLYLTTIIQAVQANQARQSCAPGFHMAYLSEIHDASAFEYDVQLGATPAPQGGGLSLPTAVDGWIRTGYIANSGGNPTGEPNCNDYSTAAGNGTVVRFSSQPLTQGSAWAPWVASTSACNALQSVWCIED